MTSRLLLIDDDTRLAAMVGDYLRAAGLAVEHAATLAAGREQLAANGFDALVLDLMLPDGDGLDLCRELRASPRTRHLPLLMLTARALLLIKPLTGLSTLCRLDQGPVLWGCPAVRTACSHSAIFTIGWRRAGRKRLSAIFLWF